jgi:hypothetical protein
LCLATIFIWKHSIQTRFWLLILFLSSLFALGESLPGIAWIAQLPGMSLLRVPARALFLTQFAMLVLASQAIHALGIRSALDYHKRINLLSFGLIVLLLLLWLSVRLITKEIPVNFLWGGSILLAGIVWMLYCQKKARQNTAWTQRMVYGIILICLLDWGIVDRSLFVSRPADQVQVAQAAAEYLSLQTGDFRVYSPSYSLPQQSAVGYNIELASGVDPVQLSPYVEFMQLASGVPSSGYHVTIPPFANGNPQEDNRLYQPRADLLGLLNVRYVLSAFPVDAAGLEQISIQDGTYIYLNQLAYPRAWVEQGGVLTGQQVTIVQFSPNQWIVQAQGPGVLVLSEIVYPGWQAQVDGEPVAIQAYRGLLRSVILPEGVHQVSFALRPASLLLGLIVFLLTAGAIVAHSFVKFYEKADGNA